MNVDEVLEKLHSQSKASGKRRERMKNLNGSTYETLCELKAVMVRVPKATALKHKEEEKFMVAVGKTFTVPEHFHNGVNMGGVWINRLFEEILPSEDAGKERIFDIVLERKTLEDGRWFVQMILVKTDRVIAKNRMTFLPRGRSEASDIPLDHTGKNYLRVERVQMYYCTCSKCGKRVQMTHKPNPKFAGSAYLCPVCLPRHPRQKKSTEQRQRETGLRQLRDIYKRANR